MTMSQYNIEKRLELASLVKQIQWYARFQARYTEAYNRMTKKPFKKYMDKMAFIYTQLAIIRNKMQ
jgi:hypothetical protein